MTKLKKNSGGRRIRGSGRASDGRERFANSLYKKLTEATAR